MLEKSRKRMVLFIVTILILVIGAMLGIIYFTTYVNVVNENKDMLTVFAESYAENGFPSQEEGNESFPNQPSQDRSEQASEQLLATENPQIPKDGEAPTELPEGGATTPSGTAPGNEGNSHIYEISTFYAVSFNLDGSTKDYMNDSASGLTDQELIDKASSLLEKGAGYGHEDGIVYLITEGEDYTLVTMMDTSVTDDTIDTLMRYMLVFGAIAICLLVVLSILLSNWIMKPAAEAYDKQRRFISDAGHELKTPIATIGANTEILKQEIADSKWLDNIIYENNRMSLIVKELLDLARMENVKPLMEEIDFSSLCLASIMPFEATAFESHVELDYDIEEGIRLRGNQEALEKLLGILTDNAISHCSPPGQVKAKLSKTSAKGKAKVLLSVTNTGEALSKEEIANMFERFYRKEEARTGGQGHYGLGLSIAKAIVEAHAGKLEVNCKAGVIEFLVIFEA